MYVLSRWFPSVCCFQRWTHDKKIAQSFLSTARIITKYSSESRFFLITVNWYWLKAFFKFCKLKLVSNLILGQIVIQTCISDRKRHSQITNCNFSNDLMCLRNHNLGLPRLHIILSDTGIIILVFKGFMKSFEES